MVLSEGDETAWFKRQMGCIQRWATALDVSCTSALVFVGDIRTEIPATEEINK